MKLHARFSPSRLEGLEACPKFERVELKDEADEGTLIHEAMETRDLKGLTPDQKQVAEACLAYTDSLVSAKGGGIVLKEEKVELVGLTYGHLDFAVIFPDNTFEVADYKTGRGDVLPAAKNIQIQSYAAALMEMRPELTKGRMHIVQPRVGQPNFAECDRFLIAEVRARIELVYQRSGDPFSAPTPGEHCERCQWAHKCPSLKPAVVQTANIFALPAPEVMKGDVPATLEDRYKLQMLASLFEKLAEQWKDSNKTFMIEGGQQIPGLVIRERSTGPKVPAENMVEALRKLRDTGYATEEQIMACLKLSIAELSKQMVEIRGGTDKEERGKILDILGDLVTEGSTRYLAKAPKGKG